VEMRRGRSILYISYLRKIGIEIQEIIEIEKDGSIYIGVVGGLPPVTRVMREIIIFGSVRAQNQLKLKIYHF
jgi:hypothetical protein